VTLPIFFEDILVGAIDADAGGAALRYEGDWRQSPGAFPVSLTMPLASEAWGAEIATPWLMNLLPEGQPLRAMTRALGVAQEDILGLIAEAGRDLAGALAIGAPRARADWGYRSVEDPAQLERIIEELPARPFLIGEDGVSMSLAGAQEKLPVAHIGEVISIPVNGAPSTHILKPDNSKLAGSVANEALCMVLARRSGLAVAEVATGRAGARSYLLVTRYDRLGEGRNVRRLHQEDFCQALGRPPVAKYQHNQSGIRGPSLPEMFAVVRENMTARDTTRLLDAVIFNIAIGNVDSHAKNYSILLRPRTSEMAPLYDLMSGLVWANITQNHAQDVGGQQRGRHIYGRHWRRMALACGLAGPATLRRVEQLTTRLLKELPVALAEVAAMPSGDSLLLRALGDAIAQRATLVRANARLDGDERPDPVPEPIDSTTTYSG